MVTMGDVLAVAAGLFGICFATWALLLASALLFMRRSELAEEAIRRSPGKTIFKGLLLAGVLGVIGLALLSQPLPVGKLLGWLMILALLATSALGLAGLARIIAARVAQMEPNLSEYACLVRAAMVLVVPGILPFLGWFLIAPLLLFAGAGAGMAAVLARAEKPVVEAQVA
jgi:hypothetical protein